ncbi:unnamed protein product [Brachionus calyciflorus]|uniref:Uncharacterized protein n=1 Tax=Brachionus calyciflorus TaxID=104777 RepID=A0A814BQW4_9BILA|nr:unnamed protein product [Brachionus calyciflorus]
MVNDYSFTENSFIEDVNFSKNRILELSPDLFSLMSEGKVKVNFTENSDFYDFQHMLNHVFVLNNYTETDKEIIKDLFRDEDSSYNFFEENFKILKVYNEKYQEFYAKKSKNDLETKKK